MSLKKKKSQWYAMFDAVMYRCIPVVRVAYISLFFNFPKSGQSIPLSHINKYMTWVWGIVAWMVSPLTSIHSFNPSDFKELSLFYTWLPTTSVHSICTFQAGSKGASWPSAPWPECVCVWFVDDRGLYGASLKTPGQEHCGTSEEPSAVNHNSELWNAVNV